MKVLDQNFSCAFALKWPEDEVDMEATKRSFNQADATEDGAEAIGILLSIERTDYTAIERATTTTGIDYWLGYKDNPNNPFKRAGRLEISGIFKESETNTVARRVEGKLIQTRPTAHTFPVYVVVVEFGKPYATMVKK